MALTDSSLVSQPPLGVPSPPPFFPLLVFVVFVFVFFCNPVRRQLSNSTITTPHTFATHCIDPESRPINPTGSIPDNLRVLSPMQPLALEKSGMAPSVAELLSDPPATCHVPEKPAPQQFLLGHGLPLISKSMAERILAGAYIDFADLPPAKGKIRPLSAPEGSVILVNAYDLLQQRRLIPDLATWLQCCSLYAAVICSRYPARSNNIFGFMSQIAKASQRFKWPSWVIYDLNFWQEAASRAITEWAQLDPSLFAQCFMGQSKQHEPWCKMCHSLDHGSDSCPTAPPQQKRPKFTATIQSTPPPRSQEACRRYNKELCIWERCRFKHCCLKCSGPHHALRCPRKPTPGNKPLPTD